METEAREVTELTIPGNGGPEHSRADQLSVLQKITACPSRCVRLRKDRLRKRAKFPFPGKALGPAPARCRPGLVSWGGECPL